MSAHVTVSINGRSYRMACDPGEEDRLVALAQRLEKNVIALRDSFGEIGDQRLTVMAAVMAVDELFEAERRLTTLELEKASLQSAHDKLSEQLKDYDTRITKSMTGAAATIEQLAEKLAEPKRAIGAVSSVAALD